jgi:hypothetical protein
MNVTAKSAIRMKNNDQALLISDLPQFSRERSLLEDWMHQT